MRNGAGRWLSCVALACLVGAQDGRAQGGRFADYVDAENPTPQVRREEYIMLDVKEKNLRDVLRAISDKVGINIIADPNVDENVTVRLDQVEWRQALDVIARQTSCKIVEETPRLIRFTQPPTISMEFQDANLKTVLDLVAKQSGANIVVAEDVKGTVSLSLREVPWEDALNTIVRTSGYAIVEDLLPSSGTKILRVVHPDSLVQQLETCFIQLKYVRPEEAYRAVITNVQNQAVSTLLDKDGKARQPGTDVEKGEFPLLAALRKILSKNGDIQYDVGTNSFYVKDIKPRIDEIKRIVAQIDRRTPQVHVKVRFITTANIDLFEKGLRFADPQSGERTGNIGAIMGAAPERQWFLPPTRNDVTGENVAEYISNELLFWGGTFPFDAGHWGSPVHGFHTLGILDFTRAEILISMIEDDENSRIIQAPELTTLDGTPATIFVGESIPFAEQSVSVDQNGNVTVSLKENDRSPVSIGFTLYLTPHVIPGTTEVDFSVIPKISNLVGKSSPQLEGFERFNFGDSFIDLPRESAQTVVTAMRVEQGHTAVIGGLQTETRTEITTKVPILSSIPILGHLFTYHREQHRVQAVLILITPVLVENVEQSDEISQQALRRLQEADYFHKKTAKGSSGEGEGEEKESELKEEKSE